MYAPAVSGPVDVGAQPGGVGHGHRYGPIIVNGWAAVAAPPGWTEADTTRLRTHIDGS